MSRATNVENVKKVLFGNQKQADAINDSVCGMVVDYLSDHGYGEIDSVSNASLTIEKVVRQLIEKAALDDADTIFLKLVVGERGYSNIKSGEVVTLEVLSPNPDSPKVHFIASIFGDEGAAVPMSLAPDEALGTVMDASNKTEDEYVAYVKELKQKMLPLVPSAIKSALADEAEQCLCIAQYYFQ